jgi:hypothetical protein
MRALLLVAACLLAEPVRPFSNGAPTICDPMSPIWGCFGRLHVHTPLPRPLATLTVWEGSPLLLCRVRAVLVPREAPGSQCAWLGETVPRTQFTAEVAMGAATGASEKGPVTVSTFNARLQRALAVTPCLFRSSPPPRSPQSPRSPTPQRSIP